MSVLGGLGVFDSSEKRHSDDSIDTRNKIASLIKDGKITLESALAFFNHGCGIYRRAESIYLISDGKINIEFQYAARAFASYLNGHDEEHKTLALLDAFQASRHIINDSLDLILSRIRDELKRSQGISSKKSIDDDDIVLGYYVYDEIFNEVNDMVDESRRKRGIFRYEAYLNMLNSDKYSKLCSFLILIERGLKKLKRERSIEVSDDRKFIKSLWTPIAWSLGSAFFTIIVGAAVSYSIAMYPQENLDIGKKLKCVFSGCPKLKPP